MRESRKNKDDVSVLLAFFFFKNVNFGFSQDMTLSLESFTGEENGRSMYASNLFSLFYCSISVTCLLLLLLLLLLLRVSWVGIRE